MDTRDPIAWTALEPGAAVLASNGEEVGRVAEVVADEQKDIFSGVAFRPGRLDRQLFAAADDIDEITAGAVLLRIPSNESGRLEPYEG